jgi:hypothetical protein
VTQAASATLTVPRTNFPVWPRIRARVAVRIRATLATLWEPGTRALVIPLALFSVVSLVATAASPWLIHHPLLLIALSPRVAFLAVAATKVPLIPFLVIGGMRLALADPIHYLLGARFGLRSDGNGSGRRWIRALGAPAAIGAVLCWPNGRHLFLAGALRSRVAWIVVADAAGTIVYLLALRGAADWIW